MKIYIMQYKILNVYGSAGLVSLFLHNIF